MESMRKATASAGMAGKDLSVMFQKNNASTQRALATAPASWESVSVFPDTKEKYVKKVRASFQYLASGYSLAGLSAVSFCNTSRETCTLFLQTLDVRHALGTHSKGLRSGKLKSLLEASQNTCDCFYDTCKVVMQK